MMESSSFLTAIAFVVAAFILAPIQIRANCNECSQYDIACINETSFNICFNGQPNTAVNFTCPLGQICSTTNSKCVDAEVGSKPACAPNKGCRVCDGSRIFACTSNTTFAQCNGYKLTQFAASCPNGLVCNSEGGDICKNGLSVCV